MNRLTRTLFLLLAVFTQACVNQQSIAKLSVSPVDDQEAINAVSMGCNSPYPLPQDCDVWQGANRVISVNGNKIRVGASENGRLVLMMPHKDECGIFATDCLTIASNRNARVLKDLLEKEGIGTEKIIPVATIHTIVGYVIFLDRDGYTLLKKFTLM